MLLSKKANDIRLTFVQIKAILLYLNVILVQLYTDSLMMFPVNFYMIIFK